MAKVIAQEEGKMMLAAHVTEWCEPGTVPEKIKFGQTLRKNV